MTSKKVKISSEKKSTITKTVTGLKSKKTYYVRLRACTVVDGKTYYSAWSPVKNVKTK